jgi:hypothetical protein
MTKPKEDSRSQIPSKVRDRLRYAAPLSPSFSVRSQQFVGTEIGISVFFNCFNFITLYYHRVSRNSYI